MNTILRVALAAAKLGAVQQGLQSLQRLAISAAAGGIALFCALAALLWLDAALWFWCLPMIGPALSALVCGGALILVAAIILLALRLSRPARRPARPPVEQPAQMALVSAEKAGREMNRFVRDNPKSALALAILAGLALSSRARR